MQKRGLGHKTVITFTLILTICCISIALILSFWFKDYCYRQKKAQLDRQTDRLSDLAIKYNRDYTSTVISEIKSTVQVTGKCINAYIMITNDYGSVYAASDNKYNGLDYANFLGDYRDKVAQGESITTEGTYNKLFKEKMYIYIKPINYNGSFYGAVAIFTPIKYIETEAALSKIYFAIWASALSIIFVGFFIIYYSTKRMIIKPLSQINSVARKISKGEVERRVDINSKDEIGQLAESFNIMADFLEKVENNRRDFISNVSHELRSPITSIKGFIGGILDGVIPKDKEEYYLSVAYEEIQRLTRLVNDLLDLSAMEAGKFTLKIDSLDINEIVRICVIKFETRINQKKLKVNVTLEDEQLYAVGDKDRVIQIVTNLLDNAIKYVNDKGNIVITTKSKGDKVVVSVYDNGPSIPKEDLKHIWERFYKSDKSRTSKLSTGLGLPIVRNILTQLGEDIWVENGEKVGVTFYFTLKKV